MVLPHLTINGKSRTCSSGVVDSATDEACHCHEGRLPMLGRLASALSHASAPEKILPVRSRNDVCLRLFAFAYAHAQGFPDPLWTTIDVFQLEVDAATAIDEIEVVDQHRNVLKFSVRIPRHQVDVPIKVLVC